MEIGFKTPKIVIRLTPYVSVAFVVVLILNWLLAGKGFPRKLIDIAIDKELTIVTTQDKDGQTYTLHKGDTVKFLGYKKSSDTYNMVQAYVQTRNGLRGYLNAYELGYPSVYIPTHDTVTILKPIAKEEVWKRALVLFPDGKEKEINYSKLGVILPDNLKKLAFNDSGARYLSERKFKQKYLGKSLEKSDKINDPAILINRNDDGTYEAYYKTLWVFRRSDGQFYHPVVMTDDSKVITDYRLEHPQGNNRRLLKWMPLTGQILDSGFLASAINSSFYDNSGRLFDVAAGNYNFLRWIIILLFAVLGPIWLMGPTIVIMYCLQTCMERRWLFKPLDDPAVVWIFRIIALIVTYTWLVLILSWGLLWFFAILIFIPAFYAYMNATKDLDVGPPHNRCIQCRRLHTMQFTESVFVREYDAQKKTTEYGNVIGRKRLQHVSYTKIEYKDGHEEHKDKILHSNIYDVVETFTYEVNYHVKVYRDIFNCSACGQEESYEREEEMNFRKGRLLETGTALRHVKEEESKRYYGRIPED